MIYFYSCVGRSEGNFQELVLFFHHGRVPEIKLRSTDLAADIGLVLSVFNPNTSEVEAGNVCEFVSSRPAGSNREIWESQIHSETLS